LARQSGHNRNAPVRQLPLSREPRIMPLETAAGAKDIRRKDRLFFLREMNFDQISSRTAGSFMR